MENRIILLAFIQVIFTIQGFSQETVSNSNSINEVEIGNISCFVYHRFGDDRYPSTNITLKNFESHLQYLEDNKYTVLTLGEAVHLLLDNKSIPHKTVVLTIDDGYKSFFIRGMPLLRKFGFRATVFINTRQVGYPDFMTWEDIRSVMEEGVEIGNHSHSHDYFVDYSPVELIEKFNIDLNISQEMFNEKTGRTPDMYSYPYGEYSNSMKAELKRHGFKAAVAQNSGVISALSDIYALPRFPMTGVFSKPEKFAEKIKMKALLVKPAVPYDPVVLYDNPPNLKLKLVNPELIETVNLQCFVGGSRECEFIFNKKSNIITIKSNKVLTARRTLYTITAPSAKQSNVWHWYSWLWIIPGGNK